MQTRTLRTLTRIARTGSFAVAARQLNMTLSAVSMQMKGLEAELGASLFDRAFRPPRLTPAGREAAARARAVLLAEDALRGACAPTDRLAGRYRLGFVATAAVRLLPGFLGAARETLPDASFDFETGLSEALEARVRAGTLDAAVVTAEEGAPDGLARLPVRREPFVFAAHAALIGPSPARTLAAAPFLQFRPGTGIGRQVAATVPEDRTGPRIVLDSVETIMECVRQRLGATLLPRPDVERYADADTVLFDVPGMRASRALVLATRADDPLTPRARLLAAAMAEG